MQNKKKQKKTTKKGLEQRFQTFRLKIKSSEKLSLGEYGRQRTSTKFHDLLRYKGRLRIKSK